MAFVVFDLHPTSVRVERGIVMQRQVVFVLNVNSGEMLAAKVVESDKDGAAIGIFDLVDREPSTSEGQHR